MSPCPLVLSRGVHTARVLVRVTQRPGNREPAGVPAGSCLSSSSFTQSETSSVRASGTLLPLSGHAELGNIRFRQGPVAEPAPSEQGQKQARGRLWHFCKEGTAPAQSPTQPDLSDLDHEEATENDFFPHGKETSRRPLEATSSIAREPSRTRQLLPSGSNPSKVVPLQPPQSLSLATV